MRSTYILALLFTTHVCAAQTATNELIASLLPGNLLRIADVQPRLESTVTICLVTDPNHFIVGAAETLTSLMFAAIRVKLDWRGPASCPAGAGDRVFLMLETPTPDAYLPGALGVALPLEGHHAWVFYDRVLRAPDYAELDALLAHVMAHEIAHVLQGIIRHSESGILKAHWSGTDCARMKSFPLMFTREDVILIHHGLEERRERLISSGSAAVQTDRSRRENSVPVP